MIVIPVNELHEDFSALKRSGTQVEWQGGRR